MKKAKEDSSALIDLLKAAEDLDRLLSESAGAGFDTGRLSGILEAYDFLISRGHSIAAKSLKNLVEDETIFMKSKGSC